jgi:carboxyl-terminal processing protease
MRIILTIFLFFTSISFCPVFADSITGRDYVDRVLAIIKESALNRKKIDWVSRQKQSNNLVLNAPKDGYPFLNEILTDLGDNHSHLVKSDLSNTAPVQKISTRLQFEQYSKSTYCKLLNLGNSKLGYISVRPFYADLDVGKAFANDIQAQISQLDSEAIGWIVDLRGNTGGQLWPPLAALGPLVGSRVLGKFIREDGTSEWFYNNGSVGFRSKGDNLIKLKLDSFSSDIPYSKPIALLIDNATGSSAECLVISFKSRPNTVLIGTATSGLSTTCGQFKLPNGDILFLALANVADLSGKVYDKGIEPDIKTDRSGNINIDFDEAFKWMKAHKK